jgi:type I restriction enzyme S subunit
MSFPRYPAYKPSGVEWLGQIPEHWGVLQSRRMFKARREAAKEGAVMLTASQKYGMISQVEFVEIEGRRVVEVIQGKDNLIQVEPDDFVISMRSFQGGLEWCRLSGSTSFHYVPVTPIKHVVPSFFAHLLKSDSYISALRATTNLIRDGQEIRYSNFVQVPLPLIPESEQIAISSFLDRETAKIDALIAEQQRLIELLQEKRQAVISHSVTKGLNPNAPIKDSGVEWLGEVPEHWEVCGLSHILNAIGDVDHYMPSTVEEGVPYLMTGDLQELTSQIDFDQCKKVSHEEYEKLSRKIKTAKGDLVMARYATIGTVAYVDVEQDLLVSYSCVTMKPNNERACGMFLFFCLKSDSFAQGLKCKVNANTQENVGIGDLKKVRVAIPPLSEQQQISEYLQNATSGMAGVIQASKDTVRLLQERRSALISAAVTGQIDVRGLVPEAAEQ